MTRHNYVELLAPAGSEESLRAAFRAGADAAYIGGTQFGARAYAENPDDEGLKSAIDFAHLHGRRLYLTVNTLLKENELEKELSCFLDPLYRHGLDAVLVQDFGVFSFIRENYPKLPIHISTQMTVASPWGAKALADMGAERLVLPRELSLAEIKAVHDAAGIEVETFIHGALCYCYSGQCLMSSLIGGRSGNRGRCAQPCRLPVNGRYLMNMKDICTLDILPQILSAGVASLKIEGRMKGPRYTAGVVSIYRKYLDRLLSDGTRNCEDDCPGNVSGKSRRDSKKWTVGQQDRELLRLLFDRGGFSEGYYRHHNGPEMIAAAGKPDKRIVDESRLACFDRYLEGDIVEPVKGRLVLKRDMPARLEVRLAREGTASEETVKGNAAREDFIREDFIRGDFVREENVCKPVTYEAQGPAPQAAQKRAFTEADVRKQMDKTGGSGYRWESLDIYMEDGLFMPVSSLNALRRDAFAGLSKEICDAYRRND